MPMPTMGKKKKIMWEINIVPLTDVCLVLLIIFMITATFLTTQMGLNVKLPKAATAAPQPGRDIDVTIAKDGRIFVDYQRVPDAQLYDVLSAKAKEGVDRAVIINADRAVIYDKVVYVIDTAKLVGLNKIALAAELKELAKR